MERAIYICARIGHHFYLADVELCPFGIMLAGIFPRKKITDNRCGETLVRDHPVFHFMAKIDQFF
jgi:hypothetical protein